MNRECRRKHWRAWQTKTQEDGRQVVVCMKCGAIQWEAPCES